MKGGRGKSENDACDATEVLSEAQNDVLLPPLFIENQQVTQKNEKKSTQKNIRN